jgi:hypothetical protein
MNFLKAKIGINENTGSFSITILIDGAESQFGFFNSFEDAENALNFMTGGRYELVESFTLVPTLEQELNDPHNEWGTWDCGA